MQNERLTTRFERQEIPAKSLDNATKNEELLKQLESRGGQLYQESIGKFDDLFEETPTTGSKLNLIDSADQIKTIEDLEFFLNEEEKEIELIRKTAKEGISLDKVNDMVTVFTEGIGNLKKGELNLGKYTARLMKIEGDFMAILIQDWLEEFRTETSFKYQEKASTPKLLFMAKRANETGVDLKDRSGITDSPAQLQQKMLAGEPIHYKNLKGDQVNVIVPTSKELVEKVKKLNPNQEPQELQMAA